MIIFDLACLANDEHRRHFIEPYRVGKDWIPCWNSTNRKKLWVNDKTNEQKYPDYKAYNETCDGDEPIHPVITIWNLYEVLIAIEHANLQIWTDRYESCREKTVLWLEANIYTARIEDYEEMLKMRPIGDTKSPEVLFEEWLDLLCARVPIDLTCRRTTKDCHGIDFVFSSHKPTIEMFRRRGVFVFDCNQGFV